MKTKKMRREIVRILKSSGFAEIVEKGVADVLAGRMTKGATLDEALGVKKNKKKSRKKT